MACLTSIPMVSAFAAALLCCAEPMAAGAPRAAWPGARSFQTLTVLALLEAWVVGYRGARLRICCFCSFSMGTPHHENVSNMLTHSNGKKQGNLSLLLSLSHTETSTCTQISLDILDHSSISFHQLLPSATSQSLPSGDFLLHHWRISALHPCLGLAHCCGGVFQPFSGGLEPAEPAIRVHGGHGSPCEPLGGGQAFEASPRKGRPSWCGKK